MLHAGNVSGGKCQVVFSRNFSLYSKTCGRDLLVFMFIHYVTAHALAVILM